MAWVLGIFLFLILLLAFPGFRKTVGVLLIILALIIGYWYVENENKEKKEASLITAQEIELRNLVLVKSYSGSSYDLKGSIKNNSSHTLKQVRLLITAQDCLIAENNQELVNYKLPDGTILEDVPANMSEQEIIEKLDRNDIDTSGLKSGESILQKVERDRIRSGDTTEKQCETIGQTTASLYTTIPAGQVREVSDYVYFSSMPTIKNKFEWFYSIEGIKGSLD